MGKPKKKPEELTTNEAIERLFGKHGAEILKRVARELDEEKPKKRKKTDGD